MQISKAMADLMNAQVGNELGASNQYVQIASYFDGESLSKLAKFFYKQAEEEREHAMKFVHYLMDVSTALSVPAIPAAKTDIGARLGTGSHWTDQRHDGPGCPGKGLCFPSFPTMVRDRAGGRNFFHGEDATDRP